MLFTREMQIELQTPPMNDAEIKLRIKESPIHSSQFIDISPHGIKLGFPSGQEIPDVRL